MRDGGVEPTIIVGTKVATSHPEVEMRLMHTLCGALVCSALVVTPALAGQRGEHPTPAPAAVHPTAPEHPANAAGHPEHPANNIVRPGPVPTQVMRNPALVSRLTPLLPPGVTLAAAAAGFKNQGQFIAALHVSRNLDIPFAALKAEMVGPDHDSLGQAIHELRPTANAQTAVETAEHEADVDIHATVVVRTTTTSAKTDAGK